MGDLNHPQFFVVIGTQRTGTTLLRHILNSSDQIAMVAEILTPYPDRCHWNEFTPTLPDGWWPPANEAAGMRLLDRYFDYFHNEIRANWEKKRTTAVALGIDIKFDQLQVVEPPNWTSDRVPFFLSYAKARGFVIINTVRDNLVQAMISYLVGMQRDFWHNYDGRQTEAGYTLDVGECLAYLRSIQERQRVFERAMGAYPVISVRYEELASAVAWASPTSDLCASLPVLSVIADALSVAPSFRHDGALQKAINRPYREVIVNHADLLDALGNSEYSVWIDSIR